MLSLHRKMDKASVHPKKPIFGIHGGGKIGLGLMADILSRDKANFQVMATSGNTFLNYLINHTPYFGLQHGTLDNKKNTKVDSKTTHLRMISRDSESIIKLYETANIVAICLTSDVFSKVANDIAHGLISRYKKNDETLNVIVMMNKPKSEEFVRETLIQRLCEMGLSEDETKSIIAKVKFIPAVVDRIVTDIKIDAIKDQLRKQLHAITPKGKYWFIDPAKPFTQQIEGILLDPRKLAAAITHFNLHYAIFNAEEEFNLFLPDTFTEGKQFPSIKLVKNIDLLETIKNKYINGPHAILAWSGALLGCNTIAEAIKYPGSLQFIKEMMEKEICPILIAEYPDITIKELDFLKKSFFARCERSKDDLVTRVGRDPLRKIASGERIRGTIELNQKLGLNVPTTGLEFGIAASILYALEGKDPTNPGCQQIVNIFNKNNHNYKAVLCYKGPYNNGTFVGFDPERDKVIVNNIVCKIKKLDSFCKNAKFYNQLNMAKGHMYPNVTLTTALPSIPRSLISPQEKTWIHSLVAQQYSLTQLLQDPQKAAVTHKQHFSVSHKIAKRGMTLFSHPKEMAKLPKPHDNRMLTYSRSF